ncbi:carbonic anhydrase [Gloeocapsa sp. PCC 73106]|uniref:carbonic anhydrase n=1 Tax=Gloeocapsa sp. PCC 73106 TaxID=102232 RepID=UPI0002AC9CC4|nr:carbonic anhydrase [Gloeocapsa sp. PCC 73106]ELR97303.1 carbonic anhydrase [Gloeocapsa sp. PCC 73106]
MSHLSRRQLIHYGGGFLGTGLAATILGSNFVKPQEASAYSQTKQDLTPDEAIQRLTEGNKRFVAFKQENPNQDQIRLTEVADGQTPFAAILSCADSRVPTELVFDQGLGDLFVCRIAGNIATPQQIGSLEFGTMVLGARALMVIGHSRCGAVDAALKGGDFPGEIDTLVSTVQEGTAGVEPGENQLEAGIRANVMHQVKILNQSPVLTELIDKAKLKIVGAYYNLDDGTISIL